jgi:hypothetical protein
MTRLANSQEQWYALDGEECDANNVQRGEKAASSLQLIFMKTVHELVNNICECDIQQACREHEQSSRSIHHHPYS